MSEELKAKDDEILKLFKMCNEKDKQIERLNNIIDKAIKICEEDKESIWKEEGAYMEYFEEIIDILKGEE